MRCDMKYNEVKRKLVELEVSYKIVQYVSQKVLADFPFSDSGMMLTSFWFLVVLPCVGVTHNTELSLSAVLLSLVFFSFFLPESLSMHSPTTSDALTATRDFNT